jgi:hypothetical protein
MSSRQAQPRCANHFTTRGMASSVEGKSQVVSLSLSAVAPQAQVGVGAVLQESAEGDCGLAALREVGHQGVLLERAVTRAANACAARSMSNDAVASLAASTYG